MRLRTHLTKALFPATCSLIAILVIAAACERRTVEVLTTSEEREAFSGINLGTISAEVEQISASPCEQGRQLKPIVGVYKTLDARKVDYFIVSSDGALEQFEFEFSEHNNNDSDGVYSKHRESNVMWSNSRLWSPSGVAEFFDKADAVIRGRRLTFKSLESPLGRMDNILQKLLELRLKTCDLDVQFLLLLDASNLRHGPLFRKKQSDLLDALLAITSQLREYVTTHRISRITITSESSAGYSDFSSYTQIGETEIKYALTFGVAFDGKIPIQEIIDTIQQNKSFQRAE